MNFIEKGQMVTFTSTCEVVLFLIQFLKKAGVPDDLIIDGLVGGLVEAITDHKNSNPDYDSSELMGLLNTTYSDTLAEMMKKAYSK
jgi:hypothetical protein